MIRHRLHADPPLLAPLLLAVFLIASLPLQALTGDTLQPVEIYSQQQSLDLKTNSITFTGDVVVTQGTITIHAEKVVVVRSPALQAIQRVEAYGHPATFYQLLDDQQPVEGYGQKMLYDAQKSVVILQQKARLRRLTSDVQGDTITYEILKQKVCVSGGPNQRVKACLHPKQLPQKSQKPN